MKNKINPNKGKRFPNRFSMIRFFMKGSVRYFVLSVVFVCLLVLFELVNPKIIGYTVDFVTRNFDSIPALIMGMVDRLGGVDYCLANLWIFSLIVIAIALLGAICRYTFRMFNSLMAEHLVEHMRDSLYEQVIHLPFTWHDNNRTGDIIQRATSDVDMIKNFISDQMTNLFRMVILITLAIAFMANIHGKLVWVSVTLIPVVVGASLIFHAKIGSAFEKVDTEEGKLSAIAQENISGLRVVRAFGRERYERDRFETKNEHYTGLWIKMMRILGTFWTMNDIIGGAQMTAVLSVGAYFAVKGDMSAGDYVAFLAYNATIIWPVRQLGRTISELSKAGVSIDRLMYIMNSEREKDAPGAGAFPEHCDIDFKNVTFAYTDKNVLNNLSLHIGEGQTVGILGGTGTGKSTLLALLDGLYDVSENGGSITIGGVDIKNIRKSELRKNVGLVLQEPYLFSRSLEDNIKIAVDADHEAVEKAVETASLKETISRFNEGYETYVGEKGVTLSGGQKQRTAIARTLIRKTPIMIFDDSLSAVDAQTDARIRAGLMSIGRETTVILISHRITTIMNADRIFVIEDGHICEEGSHDELMKLGGRYRHIFNLQSAMGEEAQDGQE
ncbi:MAG: ABC transporter ATP-binding protein/permease [Lachnospiraceae bacterium]|nr:ABC transporter ATP-binding protein/permease [Lachnospiraceae bacterium]